MNWTEDQKKAYQQAVLDQALKYEKLGLAVFPLEFASKRPFFEKLPLIEEKGEKKHKWEPLADKRPDAEQVRQWFSADLNNIAVIQGAVSGNLVVLDFDEEPVGIQLAEYMMGETLENLGAKTIIVKTKKGAHVYLRTDALVQYEKFDNLTPAIKMEIRADVHYVVAPPSIHPDSGQPYAFIGPGNQVMTVRGEQYKKWRSDLNQRLEEWPYVREILPYWKAPILGKPETGGRQNLCLGVAAFFRKILEWPQERAEQIIHGICLITQDEEERQRINAVQSTYHKEDLDTVGTQRWLGEDLFTILKAIPRPEKKAEKKTRKKQEANVITKEKLPTKVSKELLKELESAKIDDFTDIICKPFVYFEDGRIAREIWTGKKPAFVIYDPKTDKWALANKVVDDLEQLVLPVWDGFVGVDMGIQLPSEPAEYGDAKLLFDKMLAYALKYYDPVDKEGLDQLKLCLLYVMLSGFQEQNIKYWPIINHRGQSESGKGRLAKLMFFLSDRGMWQVSPTIGSLHRAVDTWRPTLYLDEADIKDSSDTSMYIQFFNSRATGALYARYSTESMAQDISIVSGPTVMCTRKGFQDDGMESRCIVIFGKPGRNLGGPNGKPIAEPPEIVLDAGPIRNELLLFWLRNHHHYQIDYYGKTDGLSPRLQNTALILMGLAKATGLENIIIGTLRDLSTRIVEVRGETPEGKIVQALHLLFIDRAVGWPVSSLSTKYPTEQGYFSLRFIRDENGREQQFYLTTSELANLAHQHFYLNARNNPDKPISATSLGRYLSSLGIKTDVVRVSEHVLKMIVFRAEDLEYLCRKFVGGYKDGTILATSGSLEFFADDMQKTLVSLVTDVTDVTDTGARGGVTDAPSPPIDIKRSENTATGEENGLGEGIIKNSLNSPLVPPVSVTSVTSVTKSIRDSYRQKAKKDFDSNDNVVAQRTLEGLNIMFSSEILEWAIKRFIEMREQGDQWGAFHLRQEAVRQFPDKQDELHALADQHFSELETVVGFLCQERKKKKEGRS